MSFITNLKLPNKTGIVEQICENQYVEGLWTEYGSRGFYKAVK